MHETTVKRKKPRTPHELQKAVIIFSRGCWSTAASEIFDNAKCPQSIHGKQNISVEAV